MTVPIAAKGVSLIVTSLVFLLIAAFLVICRFIARFLYLKNAGGDDYIIVTAFLTTIALSISTSFELKHGLGEHISAVPPEEVTQMMKCLFVSILAYNAALTSIKLSIVLQYLRVFVGRSVRIWCWISIALVMLYGLETITTAVFSCIPVSAFWEGGGKCINKKFLWFFNASFNILLDIVIIALPMPVLSSLKLPRKQKIGLMLVFALGGFVCLVSVLRLHSVYVISTSDDPTYDNAAPALWSIIEVSTGIICACMPATKPLISRFFPHLLSTNRSRQPTQPSRGRSQTYRSTFYKSASVQLAEVPGNPKTVTRVEVGNVAYRKRDLEANSLSDESASGNGSCTKDIFVTTSMTQDVERKSEMGSEKGLIIQHQ